MFYRQLNTSERNGYCFLHATINNSFHCTFKRKVYKMLLFLGGCAHVIIHVNTSYNTVVHVCHGRQEFSVENTKEYHLLHETGILQGLNKEIEGMGPDCQSFVCWWHGVGRTNHFSGSHWEGGRDWKHKRHNVNWRTWDGLRTQRKRNPPQMDQYNSGVMEVHRVCAISCLVIYRPQHLFIHYRPQKIAPMVDL